MPSIPLQRWQIADVQPEVWPPLMAATGLPPLLVQVLINREIRTPEAAIAHLDPTQLALPDPADEFTDLHRSVLILADAIASEDPILICGDYDADGMTSTGLLIRALRQFGAQISYAIPSRMQEGYGINRRIVLEAAENCVGVILTVDNGIAALEPIRLAIELGLSVIVTDHHDIPDELPPADAILNPKLLPEWSPYRGLAGVGIAYLLARTLGEHLEVSPDIFPALLELCTLGTIADLAALTGVNRRWVKQGLQTLPHSELAGIQALMQVSGTQDRKKPLRPDAIGFRLGPRINAVGRIGDPVNVIELLTTDDPAIALEQATHCENTNSRRQQLCQTIEAEAHEVIATTPLDPVRDRVLVVYKPGWHHGVIGIVASRLVERYGVPVFICTQEGEHEIRGSARGIPEFDVYGALKYCDNLLPKYGGHPAAGGFSCPLTHLDALRDRLRDYAHQHLELHHLKPLVTIDAQADFSQLTAELYEQIEALQPWGMANPTPVFWSSQVQVVNQKTVKGNHLKVTFAQNCDGKRYQMSAIAWHWGEYQLPSPVDIAYQLTENNWQGQQRIELQLVGVRCDPERLTESAPTAVDATPKTTTRKSSKQSQSTPKKVAPDSTPAISTQLTDSPSAVNAEPVEPIPPLPRTSVDAILPRQANTNKPEVSIESRAHNSHPDTEEISAAKGTASEVNVESNEHNSHADAKERVATEAIVLDVDECLETSPSLTTDSAEFTAELSPPEGQTPAISTAQSPLGNLPEPATTAPQTEFKTAPKTPELPRSRKVQFQYRDRVYECSLANAQNELRIRNSQGKVLAVQKGQRLGLLGERRETAVQVDVTQPHYYSLIKTALAALEAVKS